MVNFWYIVEETSQINLYYSLTKRGEYDNIGPWHETEIFAEGTSRNARLSDCGISPETVQ